MSLFIYFFKLTSFSLCCLLNGAFMSLANVLNILYIFSLFTTPASSDIFLLASLLFVIIALLIFSILLLWNSFLDFSCSYLTSVYIFFVLYHIAISNFVFLLHNSLSLSSFPFTFEIISFLQPTAIFIDMKLKKKIINYTIITYINFQYEEQLF